MSTHPNFPLHKLAKLGSKHSYSFFQSYVFLHFGSYGNFFFFFQSSGFLFIWSSGFGLQIQLGLHLKSLKYERKQLGNKFNFFWNFKLLHFINRHITLIIRDGPSGSSAPKLSLSLSQGLDMMSFFYFFIFFLSVLPSSRISLCGRTDWAVMPPTLGASLLM